MEKRTTELKVKTVEELKEELQALLREQFNLRIQGGLGEKPRTHIFKKVRRDIARIKTMLHLKEVTG